MNGLVTLPQNSRNTLVVPAIRLPRLRWISSREICLGYISDVSFRRKTGTNFGNESGERQHRPQSITTSLELNAQEDRL
jgi:hypothetical protein